jgi:hypothetical protein
MTDEVYIPTAEEISKHYSACMDSVNLINAVIANPAAYVDDETVLQRNVEHLENMINAMYWTNEDMTPLNDAITAGNAAITE